MTSIVLSCHHVWPISRSGSLFPVCLCVHYFFKNLDLQDAIRSKFSPNFMGLSFDHSSVSISFSSWLFNIRMSQGSLFGRLFFSSYTHSSNDLLQFNRFQNVSLNLTSLLNSRLISNCIFHISMWLYIIALYVCIYVYLHFYTFIWLSRALVALCGIFRCNARTRWLLCTGSGVAAHRLPCEYLTSISNVTYENQTHNLLPQIYSTHRCSLLI